MELITNPNLIFLDEPTTGLDSFTATNVVEILRDLALSGRTIVSTIHQPNSDIFELFDKLMLMAGGRTLYFNDASKSVNHFKSIGYACPELTNPADYFMTMMSIESYDDRVAGDENELARSRTKIEEDYNQKITYIADKYDESDLKIDPDDMHPDALELKTDKDFRTNMFVQFWFLLIRSFLNIIRIPLASWVKLFTYVFLAVLTILVHRQVGDDCNSIQNRESILFFTTLNCIMNSVQGVIYVFPDERAVF